MRLSPRPHPDHPTVPERCRSYSRRDSFEDCKGGGRRHITRPADRPAARSTVGPSGRSAHFGVPNSVEVVLTIRHIAQLSLHKFVGEHVAEHCPVVEGRPHLPRSTACVQGQLGSREGWWSGCADLWPCWAQATVRFAWHQRSSHPHRSLGPLTRVLCGPERMRPRFPHPGKLCARTALARRMISLAGQMGGGRPSVLTQVHQPQA